MTGNVSSHLPPSRRRITRFIANMARNLAATGFDLPHAAAIESAHRSGTPPSHWAEGQANHAPETGLFFSAPLFHSFPRAPRRWMQSKPCDDDRCDAIRWENMAAARSEGFHVFPSFFRCVLMLSWGIFPFGLFPLFQCSRAFSGCLLCFHATTGNFHIQSPPSRPPPSSASSLGRHLAPPPRHQGSHGWETRPRDWIAFLDGQSRSAASLPPLHPTLLSPESSVLSAGFAVVPFSHHLTLPTRRLLLCCQPRRLPPRAWDSGGNLTRGSR